MFVCVFGGVTSLTRPNFRTHAHRFTPKHACARTHARTSSTAGGVTKTMRCSACRARRCATMCFRLALYSSIGTWWSSPSGFTHKPARRREGFGVWEGLGMGVEERRHGRDPDSFNQSMGWTAHGATHQARSRRWRPEMPRRARGAARGRGCGPVRGRSCRGPAPSRASCSR